MYALSMDDVRMDIYNRWGVLVFESHDISRGWDGTYQRRQAPAGTYVYRVDYAVSYSDFNLTGTVVLVR
ncbi:MAG: gliding motility-associated C-terminal domain-containing protein [Bacteroidota bacterium]|nr:gliding motility-associated C-terminal domain-containing protein [Bacteroidota bacterium]